MKRTYVFLAARSQRRVHLWSTTSRVYANLSAFICRFVSFNWLSFTLSLSASCSQMKSDFLPTNNNNEQKAYECDVIDEPSEPFISYRYIHFRCVRLCLCRCGCLLLFIPNRCAYRCRTCMYGKSDNVIESLTLFANYRRDSFTVSACVCVSESVVCLGPGVCVSVLIFFCSNDDEQFKFSCHSDDGRLIGNFPFICSL